MAASRRQNHRKLLWCFFILNITNYSSCAIMVPVEQKVQGAVAEAINASLFYQSYVPLLLKFRIPDWSLESLRLNKSMKCSKDDTLSLSSDFICPVSKYLDEVMNPLSQTMRFYRTIFNATGGLFYEHNFSCDKIRPHFLHFSAPIGGLAPYINEFKTRCPLGKNTTLVIKNVISTASQHAYMAYQKFKDLHEAKEQKIASSTPMSAPSIDWKSLQTAGYIAIQNSFVLSQYADSVRWANAFQSCQSSKLDIGLISPVMLNDSLTEMAKSLEGSGYTFALPFLNTLPHYYKIPLVDCMLTMSNSLFFNGNFNLEAKNDTANLIVRILIPVIRSKVIYKTYKLNKVPFLKRERGVDKICEITNFQPDEMYLLETGAAGNESIVGRISTLCLSSKLCKIPEITHRQVIDPCVTGILLNNQVLTSEHCRFDCNVIPNSIIQREKLFPIITQLLSNKYAITGLPLDAFPVLYLECGGTKTHQFKPNTTEGAILIKLPCDCELVHGTKRYGVQKPCDELLHVEHVLEFGMNRKPGNEPDDRIDYLVEEPQDPKAFNITFSETDPPEKDRKGSGNNGTGTNSLHKNTTATASAQHQQHHPLHCGHVVLWLFLLTVFVLNAFTIFLLWKNNLIDFNWVMWCRSPSIPMTRFENEIPVSNINTSGF